MKKFQFYWFTSLTLPVKFGSNNSEIVWKKVFGIKLFNIFIGVIVSEN
jgi:hypothetical protein